MSTQTSALVGRVREILGTAVDDLYERLSTGKFEEVLVGSEADLASKDLGNKPEAYTEDYLIEPLLGTVGLQVDAQPYGKSGERDRWPDGEIRNLETRVITEHKPINNVAEARPQLKEYLDRKSLGADYGIATDGVEWSVYKIELGGDFTEYPLVEEVDLRPALLAIARERGYVADAETEAEVEESDAVLSAFAEVFERDAFDKLLSQRAPRELRDARKRDVEEFYELYIELLFGESDERSYETCLMDDVTSPRGATEHDERLFAITLLNRLLFVKFLETRGVLREGFLKERVDAYEAGSDEFTGNLYETQIRPLFYKLFNTPEDERDPKYRHDEKWFSDVPYLNGGLFRAAIRNEHQYSVNDRTLPVVVRDLIEGSELDLEGGRFDPAILGSVFEKTINHIEQERTQKDIGAYYTPNDVTQLIIEQSVDPKIRDSLVEAFVEEVPQDETMAATIRGKLEGMALTEILRRIEEREGYFGDPDAVRRALDELRELKVVDPACGSGHFLTSAMDEVHRAQVSLLRCLSTGEEPTPEERYREKQALALNCIYGVDVDSIAAEIAKLRVWLKIVEGNGWDESFGALPDIDVNITGGNSLVGLPMTGTFDDVDVWSEDIREIEQRRLEYKREDVGDPRELERFMAEEIRPELNREYLEMYSKPVETEIRSVEAFDGICDAIEGPNLYPAVQLLRVRHEDGEPLAEYEDDLEALGFTVYTKSAKIDVQEWENKLKRMDEVDDHREQIEMELRRLLEGPFVFSEVRRQPLTYDLDRVLGTPFHWIAEFPEVASKNGGRHTIDFDVVLGNPPYGDLLSDAEKAFTSTYGTGEYNEISANFVERQLQLLDEEGYFGNITTLRLVYQSDIHAVHRALKRDLAVTRIACFASRPQSVFANAEVRAAIMSGKKTNPEDGGEIRTSEFVRFDSENRDEVFSSRLSYSNVEGLELGEQVGSPLDSYSIIPKIGPVEISSILESLKESSAAVFADEIRDDETDHVVWRKRHPRYWINPYLENLYPDDEKPQDFEPMYFGSELKARTAFCVLQSSLFYLYWICYGNERDLNWGQIEAFPFPDDTEITNNRERISRLSDSLWDGMKKSFEEEGVIHTGRLKPLVNEIDELVGELYGLDEAEIEYLKNYHAEYGRGLAAVESATLDESAESE